jgi:hypothetical protein
VGVTEWTIERICTAIPEIEVLDKATLTLPLDNTSFAVNAFFPVNA